MFIAYLVNSGFATSPIATYISAAGYVQKLASFKDSTQCFIICKMMVGIRKSNAKPDVRLPLTKEILHTLIHCLEEVCPSQYNMLVVTDISCLYESVKLPTNEITAIF